MINTDDLRRLLKRLVPYSEHQNSEHPDSEQAWEAYEELQRKLITFFDHNSCQVEAGELADEVLDRIARKPESFQIISMHKYAHRVAENVLREHWRRQRRHVSLVTSGSPGKNANAEARILDLIYRKEKNYWFSNAMLRLSREERELILSYYPSENDELEERRQRLSEQYNMTMVELRTEMARLRSKMERYVENFCAPRVNRWRSFNFKPMSPAKQENVSTRTRRVATRHGGSE